MYLSIVEEYFLVEVTHDLCIALINNIPLMRFSVDFTLSEEENVGKK